MLESIRISQVATFKGDDQILDKLSKLNFFFGCNGSGKTTISRMIAEAGKYPTCALTWKAGMPLLPLVYNRDFVEKNFNPSSGLKGVFTLGEENIDTIEKITKTKGELADLAKKIANLKQQLQSDDGKTGKNVELSALEESLKKTCWGQKLKHDAKLQGAFEGYRGSSEKFKVRVLEEEKTNSADLLALGELEKKAETLFGETPTLEQSVPSVDIDSLQPHEINPVLKKRVIGKGDVDIAAMIKKLGNSDWVREGRSFYEVNDSICPFCQQKTDAAFAKSLNEYFDEAFETDSKAIDDLVLDYKTDAERLQQQLSAIMALTSKFLDVEKLKAEKELFDSRITINLQKLGEKKKEPSIIVELEPINNVATAIKTLIEAANTKVDEHNKLVKNLVSERNALTSQVWKFIVEELKSELADYRKKRGILEGNIQSINSAITAATLSQNTKEQEIIDLERQITSVQPTLDGINGLLKSFGFHSFSLGMAKDKISYELLRSDGTCAKETLSEGEKTFVTFLYFYHLLKGSNSSDGITQDRIIVFDDPVSSLDSDILFIVSNLIGRIMKEVRDNYGYIKQVFVLTHNVYFHKEVTFLLTKTEYDPVSKKRKGYPPATFWIVRKSGIVSLVERYDTNPISTSYELLWSDVKRTGHTSASIQNILRRILEHYFTILGGVNPDEICEKFQGNDKFVCKSLFSWVNAGSHGVLDDLYVSDGGVAVDVYLRVFKEIFDKHGHVSHYAMMMGEDSLVDLPKEVDSGESQPESEAA